MLRRSRHPRLAPPATALLLAPALGWALSPVEVEGNRKTTDGYLTDLVHECLEDQGGVTPAAADAAALRQCVLDSELFSEVEVGIEEGAVRLRVEERWSLIPVPYFSSQRDSTSIGLFVFDRNFLGRGKQAVAGASTGDRGGTFFLLYRDPGIAFSDWTARVSALQSRDDIYLYDGEDEQQGYARREQAVRVAAGYAFDRRLELGWGLGYADRSYDTLDDFTLSPEDYDFAFTGPELTYKDQRFRFYFREGHQLRLRAERQLERSDAGDEATSYELRYEFQYHAFARHAVKLQFEAFGTDSGDLRDAFLLGAEPGWRGVERNGVWAQHAWSVAFDYQVPVLEGRFGTWVVGPFADAARFQDADGIASPERSESYGLGSFLYLKRIALPGVGIVAGRNEQYLGGFVSVQIGFQM